MKIPLKHLFLLRPVIAFFLVLLPAYSSAIVNMDRLHFQQEKDTFKADLDFKVSGSSGNTNTSKIVFNSQLSWQQEKSIHIAILGYQYGESNALTNINKAFAHYRYIYRAGSSYDWEVFTQLENNEFTRLSYRALLGTGLRFNLSDSEQHQAFAGVGAFASREKIKQTAGLTDAGIEELSRANLYLLSKYRVSDTMSISNVLYYQPRLDWPGDLRALYKGKLDFKINSKLSFRVSLDIEFDSQPSQTIKTTDILYTTGLLLSF